MDSQLDEWEKPRSVRERVLSSSIPTETSENNLESSSTPDENPIEYDYKPLFKRLRFPNIKNPIVRFFVSIIKNGLYLALYVIRFIAFARHRLPKDIVNGITGLLFGQMWLKQRPIKTTYLLRMYNDVVNENKLKARKKEKD